MNPLDKYDQFFSHFYFQCINGAEIAVDHHDWSYQETPSMWTLSSLHYRVEWTQVHIHGMYLYSNLIATLTPYVQEIDRQVLDEFMSKTT